MCAICVVFEKQRLTANELMSAVVEMRDMIEETDDEAHEHLDELAAKALLLAESEAVIL